MANKPELTAILDGCYQIHFGNVSEIVRPKDRERQLAGIDVIIKFNDCRTPIYIDEKIRRKDYGDFLLEEYSDFDNRTPGWLLSQKKTHYIAFVWPDMQKLILFPYETLRKAFLSNKDRWLSGLNLQRVFAKNKGYTTSNIAVPKQELFDAFWRSSWIVW